MTERYTRREFLGTVAQVTGTLAAATLLPQAAGATPLPQRVLGRTGTRVSILGLGFGPLGLAPYSPAELLAVAEAALDEGVSYFDLQPDYGEAERHLAPLLQRRRRDVFLVTKTWEPTRAAALASLEESLRRLQVEYLDAVLLNNVGLLDLGQLLAPDGAVAGLKEAQKKGLVRFLGVSGHMRAAAILRALGTDEFDIAMVPINFVDCHTYDFEAKVLPVAAKHGVGLVGMKVLGGAVDYSTRQQCALLPGEDHDLAIRYALAVPGVACAVIGCKNVEEMRLAAQVARRFRPLSPEENELVWARGQALAAQWGQHLGEV
ncbi:MAG: hypothetical protein A2620_00535 [Acidobacteria bacterium RIFCSPHIGHO2_01_FULL_67_28]|nr:MAG: hypothetical protein A2620_00535 [Acidobacteria bacterium RIFCSPHIGHO2_01_FULL_67_28]